MAKRKPTNTEREDALRRTRAVRPFPASTFSDALELANAVQQHSGGQPIRRLTLFDQIGKSPDSGPSRQLITNSGKYGLTEGGYQAETLILTDLGKMITSEETPPKDRARARIKAAILDIVPFNAVYEKYVGNKLPSKAVLIDAMKETGISGALAEEAVDILIVNARDVGILQTLSGAERLLTVDHAVEAVPPAPLDDSVSPSVAAPIASKRRDAVDFEKTCFYVTPIGAEGTDQRKHSDLFLGSIVEPALESLGLTVVRADAIEKPGLITKQVIEYLLKARLVVVDLSFHNPNVFYELAIRHAARLPTVQVTRAQDRIPFDVNQNRTVQIDCSTIYALVPQIETYRSQVANHARRALEDPDASDNPIMLFWPNMKVTL
jgi:hypothetical protein